MKKKTDKELLFERMNKVAGMPLNEWLDLEADPSLNPELEYPDDEDEEVPFDPNDPDYVPPHDIDENDEKLQQLHELADKGGEDAVDAFVQQLENLQADDIGRWLAVWEKSALNRIREIVAFAK